MPNILLVSDDSPNTHSSRAIIIEALTQMGLDSEAIISWVTEEPEVTEEAILLYGYALGSSAQEAEEYAEAIYKKTGVHVSVVPSDCQTVAKVDGQHNWAGYLAVYATEERLEMIVTSLRGSIVTELGVTTFDVEKHLLVPGSSGNRMKPMCIKVFDTDHLRAISITETLARKMFNRRKMLAQPLAGYLTAGEMEKRVTC